MTPSLVISQGVRTRHSSCQKDLFLYTISRIIKFLWRNGLQQLHPVTLEVSKKFFSNLDDVLIQFNSLQLFLIWRTLVLFKGPMIPLFWTDGDICPGFQSQGGSLTFMLHHLHNLHSSDSHADLLATSLPAKRFDPQYTCKHVFRYWWDSNPGSHSSRSNVGRGGHAPSPPPPCKDES